MIHLILKELNVLGYDNDVDAFAFNSAGCDEREDIVTMSEGWLLGKGLSIARLKCGTWVPIELGVQSTASVANDLLTAESDEVQKRKRLTCGRIKQ